MLFCGQPPGTSGLHRAATFQLDNLVWSCTVLQLSITDMMALEAKYYTKCLVSLYNYARKAKEEEHTDEMEAVVFAELVMYIEEQIDEEKANKVIFHSSIYHKWSSLELKQVGEYMRHDLNSVF